MSKRSLQRTLGSQCTSRAIVTIIIVAWLYVSRSDREFKESSEYPDLRNQGEPRTELASRGRRQSARREDDTEQGGDGDETANQIKQPEKKVSVCL